MRDGKIQQIGTGEEILTTPANDYVKTFVQDVDYSRVLTAQNIMEPASLLNIQAEGPNIALRRMKHDRVSMLLAVDRDRKLQGVITADAARDAKNTGKDLVDYLDTSIPTIAKDTTVNDIFNIIYDAKTPVAVTENGKVLGVVIRGSVIEALADEDAESIDTNDIVDVQPEKGDK